MTLMPEMTSFMIRTRWSVTPADLNLEEDGVDEGEEKKRGRGGEKNWRGVVKFIQVNHTRKTDAT